MRDFIYNKEDNTFYPIFLSVNKKMLKLVKSQDNNYLLGSCADYNENNTWFFNSNNGTFNNNNRYNGNFRSRPCLDYYNRKSIDYEHPIINKEMLYQITEEMLKGKGVKRSFLLLKLYRIGVINQTYDEMAGYNVYPTEMVAHIIHEPKLREIICSTIDKRIIQTFYVKNLQYYLEKYYFHEDSYSCRINKGGLAAIKKLQEYMFEESNGYTENLWIAKIDLKTFFMSIDTKIIYDVLIEIINKYIVDVNMKEYMKYLTRIIYLSPNRDNLIDSSNIIDRKKLDKNKSLFNCEIGIGVPIGDWTSQLAGLIITTPALNFLSEMGYKFIHYTDDTVVLIKDKEKWKNDIKRLENYYKNELHLTLHPNKRYLQHYSHGVEVIGYKLKYNRILLGDRCYNNMMICLYEYLKLSKENFYKALKMKNKIQSSLNSYLGRLRQCNGYNTRKKICEIIKNSPLIKIFDVDDEYTKLTIKEKLKENFYYKEKYKKEIKWKMV